MESTSTPGRVHFSHPAFRALKEQVPGMRSELRTDLGEIKGKGRMKTYFLESL
jgi:predicted phage tail protein